jgi:diguanylate cyclase (GGDEF)-like protein
MEILKTGGGQVTGVARRGATSRTAAGSAVRAAPLDAASFLGVPEAELTVAVRAAIAGLVVELEDLRAEVRMLKARLAAAESAADQDPLTGLNNRRAFVRELKRTAAFARRHGAPASLIYFDLDGLKDINDGFGHAAGDAALKAVAQRLSAHVRESDVVGRLGGDEFAVILLHADQAQAEIKARTLAEAVEAEPLAVAAADLSLRVSHGVRQVDPAQDPEAMIAAADAAMFGTKRGRRAALA